jgi:hypothetical protein
MSELTCKTCKHSFRKLSELPIWGSGVEWRCRQAWIEETVEQDPVTGPKKVGGHYARCSTVRFRTSDICGASGKLWAPKNKKHIFLAIKHSIR